MENTVAEPVRITKDLKVVVKSHGPLTGSQALDLGRRLIEFGAVAVAREAVSWPTRSRPSERAA